MTSLVLWQRLLPLAIGAAFSPVLLLAQLAQLCRPGSLAAALRRSAALLLGALLVVLAWGAAAGWIARRLPPHPLAAGDAAAAVVQLLLGLVLACLSLRILSTETGGVAAGDEPHPHQPAAEVQGLLGPLLQGLGLMAINLSSLLLFLTAAQDVGRSGQPLATRLLAWLLLDGLTLLPVWLPPLVLLLSGPGGRRWLERFGGWVSRHRRGIEAAVAALFAAFLLCRGLSDL